MRNNNIKQYIKTRLLSIDGDASGVKCATILKAGEADNIIIPVERAFIYEAVSKSITDFIGDKIEYKKDGGVVVDDEIPP